ncbi:MAG: glycoside hydrolase family 16 protein, partial [Chitinophagaceae bacterium]
MTTTSKKKLTIVLLSIGLFAHCSSKKDTPGPGPIPPPTSVVVEDKGWLFESAPFWADEFDYTGLPATSKWDYDLGGSGWGNNEKQFYTNALNNVSVGGGKLTITARKENLNGMNYTSTRLVTRNKLDVLYGRMEIKAKLPTGRGTWPAIWMLPTDRSYGDWPKSGEIDIM